jgi:hypothetical protein
MPCSPWRRIPFASIPAGSMAQPIRLDQVRHRQLDISHGCQDHTVLPYASAPYVLRDVNAHEFTSPCVHLPRQRCRVHHIPSRVRDDRDTPLLPRQDSAEIATDLGCKESGLFSQLRLDHPNQVESVQQVRFYAKPDLPVTIVARRISSALSDASDQSPIAEDRPAGIVIDCRPKPCPGSENKRVIA